MTEHGPWHDGERAAQARAGFADYAASRGQNIRTFMPDQHRVFFAQLPFAVLGTLDRAGNPWATILSGPPGFLAGPDPKTLHIGAVPEEDDPAAEGISVGKRVALLGIELPTRRRNRMNGRIVDVDATGFTVAVEQSFGNCPQYIQRRDYRARRPPHYPAAEALTYDDTWAHDLVRRADTLFVASSTPPGQPVAGGGLDVSHRGGRPVLSRSPMTAHSKSRITAAIATSTRSATSLPTRAPVCCSLISPPVMCCR